ncbi:hypothetical protein HanRHA438_Chr09g0382901 [Helianthus annuus]|uniref:Uncharacterized protein n=1 Tax=Helianthus annuus TaxID=4232 RepID=A0A9K3I3V3_HELAN|nr:hypothetical protein HanXRQr2_Chr09g0371311 [Helianthus annuus]KAJ0524794.1 hypothetical protein HanHA300_Chr09g0304641 [Helianthus annuus]KAJ0532757.1 hypothetical protein HanIR_Chr09g0400551 [Helianthus annuus]KAJ0541167.1 hypothetical protein HanHA89_Chr09g0325381 [Helianthus annuus]KAJ0706249.1 hypothetical protein HanLR1_Chr09g0304881 [Helianthus annuus]
MLATWKVGIWFTSFWLDWKLGDGLDFGLSYLEDYVFNFEPRIVFICLF